MNKFSFHYPSSFVLVVLTWASDACSADGKLSSPTPKVGTLFDFVVAVLGIVIKISIPVVTVMFILTGFAFLTAQGDPKKLETAKHSFVASVIGAAILLGAVVIATLVKNTVGLIGG